MSRLQTSYAFSKTAFTSTYRQPVSTMLFDETALIKLDSKQQTREDYVRAMLSESKPIESVDTNDKFSAENQKATQLIMELRSKIESVKLQIRQIRQEKARILEDGVRQVRSYMEQLKQEQAEHAREMKILRDNDANISASFIQEVDMIKQQYKNDKKPLNEIVSHVKSTIVEKGIANEDSISSIQVTEIRPSDSD